MDDSAKIKTRFLILSDTHNALPEDSSGTSIFRHPLPKADVVIHCGDLTLSGKPTEHSAALQLLKSLEADLKIVIPGNHDLTLDREYCKERPRLYGWKRDHTEDDLDLARELYTNQAAREAGISYIEEGIKTFDLPNGASFTIYASAYTPEFYDWGFPYERNEDRFNSSAAEHPVPKFDGRKGKTSAEIMVTHGPPQDILDTTTRGSPAGCEHLKKAVSRCRPLLHCFGHIHEGWGAILKKWDHQGQWQSGEEIRVVATNEKIVQERAAYFDGTEIQHGRETLFVNASIMDVSYRPSQGPWLVDLLLNKGEANTHPD